MRRLALALAAAALVWGRAAADQTLTGTVVDAGGNPVAGADIGTNWQLGREQKPYDGVKSGEDGTFSITLKYWRPPVALLAMDAKRERGAVAVVEADGAAAPVTLRLEPLVALKGRFDCNEPGVKPTGGSMQWYAGKRRARIGNLHAEKSSWSLRLPPGAWHFYLFHMDLKPFTRDVELAAGEDLDLGDLDVEPNLLATLGGKPLPAWTVSDARGVEKTVQPSDYKGRWLLIEFWGYW